MDDRQQETNQPESEIKVLSSKLAQLEQQEAHLEQIEDLRQRSSDAYKRGDVLEGQRLYNRAWEMERTYEKRFKAKDGVDLIHNSMLEICQNIRKRYSVNSLF
jgi:hypothetical protein